MNLVSESTKKIKRVLQPIRSEAGAKWSVIILLMPIALFGILHFGASAAFVLCSSVLICLMAGILPRIFSGESFEALHPGSIITC